MTTQLFPGLTEDKMEELRIANEASELDWLLNSVVRPHLPEIKEGLSSCLRQVSEDNESVFKLPLSSHKSEMLKGVVERESFKIVGLSVQLKAHSFNGGKPFTLRLKEGETFILRQLLDCHDLIYNAIQTIEKIEKDDRMDLETFLTKMEQVYDHISKARGSLEQPNRAYVFPRYRLPAKLFVDDEYPEDISLDFFVNNCELSVEFQSLKRVTKRPWCLIVDKQKRVSYADKVRSAISRDRTRTVHRIIVDEYEKLKQKLAANHKEDGFWNHIFGGTEDPSLSTLLKSSKKYLEQCITYVDNEGEPFVVNINDKCEMVTPDPILLSLGVKLDSLEKAVDRMVANLIGMNPV